MRQKIVFFVVIAALLIGMISLSPAPSVEAGSKGQQLVFQKASTRSLGIDWIRIYGPNQDGISTSKHVAFNPLVNEFHLSNWWWKSYVFIEFSVKDPNGRSFYNNCWVYVPPVMSGNWVRVYVDVGSSRTCGTRSW